MTVQTLDVIPSELERAVAETGLSQDGAQTLRSAYAPHFVAFHALAVEAKDISPTAPKAARAMRLKLREVRVAAEKTRKSLKEDSVRRGKAIDGVSNLLEYQLVPIEKAMEAIEKAEEIAEAKRLDAIGQLRSEELRPYADPSFYDLRNMPEAQWDQLLSQTKSAYKAVEDAKIKAEQDRVAREAAELAERERVKVENERLKAEAIQREVKAKAEREKAEAAARVEREKAEATAKAERAKAEAERKRLDDIARAEKEKREKAEAEIARIAKEKAEAERIASENAAKLAAAPDLEKLLSFADTLSQIAPPQVKSPQAVRIACEAEGMIAKVADYIRVETFNI